MPITRRRARELIQTLLETEGLRAACEVSLLYCDDERMRQLNREYLGEDRPTDVLAFPQGPAPLPAVQPAVLGDIAICIPTAAAQAKSAHRPLAHEIEWLLLHGALHLLGYDDATPGGLRQMEEKQRAALDAHVRPKDQAPS